MNPEAMRRTLWGLATIALVAGLAFAFMPRPVPVDLVDASRGDLIVTINDEGETRIRDVFVMSAPVTGRVRRIEAEVGDPVIAEESIVAEIEPIEPTFLDARTQAQAQAALSVAESNRVLAASEFEEAHAELEFAESEVKRASTLIETRAISRQAFDEAKRRYKASRAALATARARQQVREFELVRARAQLMSPLDPQTQQDTCSCVPLRAPVDGRILQVLHESEGVVQAGEPLLEIGDASDLEVVVDFLSSDAVKVVADQRVIIRDWGGTEALTGRVDRIEPFGFTKVSALGIEEQRVNVIIEFRTPREQWLRLGHGYRVEAHVVITEARDVVKVPLTTLFREGDDWAVFVELDGVARVRRVEVGRRNGLEAEIKAGLDAGERVVIAPSDRIAEDVRIVARR